MLPLLSVTETSKSSSSFQELGLPEILVCSIKAMDEGGEDTREVSLSVRNEEDHSLESLAWADSCIVTFPDDSDNNGWGSFTDALTEIINIHPEIFVPSATRIRSSALSSDEDMTKTESTDARSFEPRAGSSNEEVSEIVSLLTFEADPSKNSLQDQYFMESTAEKGIASEPGDSATLDLEGIERVEEDGYESNNGEAEEDPESVSAQVFKDDFMNTNIEDNVADLVVSEDSVKVTPQEIFKVWNLGIAGGDDEEDGLGLQLKKALDESSIAQQQLPQALDDEQTVTGKSSVDDLISGISDLSLIETFK